LPGMPKPHNSLDRASKSMLIKIIEADIQIEYNCRILPHEKEKLSTFLSNQQSMKKWCFNNKLCYESIRHILSGKITNKTPFVREVFLKANINI